MTFAPSEVGTKSPKPAVVRVITDDYQRKNKKYVGKDWEKRMSKTIQHKKILTCNK